MTIPSQININDIVKSNLIELENTANTVQVIVSRINSISINRNMIKQFNNITDNTVHIIKQLSANMSDIYKYTHRLINSADNNTIKNIKIKLEEIEIIQNTIIDIVNRINHSSLDNSTAAKFNNTIKIITDIIKHLSLNLPIIYLNINLLSSISANITNINKQIKYLKKSISTIQQIVDTIKELNNVTIDDNFTKQLYKTLKNIIEVIKCISNNYITIGTNINILLNTYKSVCRLLNLGNLSNITGNKFHKLKAPFNLFISILELVKNISNLGDNINKRSIKRSVKSIIVALDGILKIYQELYKKILKIKIFSNKLSGRLIKLFAKRLNNIIDILQNNITNIVKLIQDNVISKRDIKKVIDNLFSIYKYILQNIILLGFRFKFIRFKNIIKGIFTTVILFATTNILFKTIGKCINDLILLGQNFVKIKLGLLVFKHLFTSISNTLVNNISVKELIIGVLKYITISKLLSKLFKELKNVFDGLNILGQNYIKTRLGLDAINTIFNDSRLNKSILTTLSTVSYKHVLKLILVNLVALELFHTFKNLSLIFTKLIELGQNYKYIRRGLYALECIFMGGMFNKSLLQIITSLTPEIAISILHSNFVIIALTTSMFLMNPLISTLIITGKNYRLIRRGIRAVRYIFKRLVKIINTVVTKFKILDVLNFAKFTLLLGISFIPIVATVSLLGLVAGLAAAAVISVTSIMVVITITILIINMTNRVKNVPDGLFDIVSMMAAMSVGAAVISSVSQMSFDFIKLGKFVISFSILMLVLIHIVKYIAKFGMFLMLKGTIMLISVSSALYVCSLIIEKLSQINIDIKNITINISCVLGIVGLASLIGLASPLLVLAMVGIISLFVVVSLLILIALELKILSELDVSVFEQAEINIDLIFKSCNKIINSFLNHTVGTPEKDNNSWTAGLLKFVGGPIAQIIEAVLAMAYVALIFVAITFVVIIAAELSMLAGINIDYDKVSENVDKIFNTSDMIIRKITEKKSDKWQSAHDKLGVFGPLITYVAQPLANILTGIFSVLQVAITFIAVTFILLIAVELSLLQKINLDETKIIENVTKVLNTADLVRNMIISHKVEQQKHEERGWLRKALGAIPLVSDMTDLIEGIMNVGNIAMTFLSIGLITLIAKNLKTLSDIELNKDTVESKVKQVLELSNMVSEKVNSTDVKTIDEDKVKSFGKYVNDSIKYFENINKLDVSKVKSIGDMYEKMGQFMEKLQDAPINDIADALVNKISPALSDINTSLNKKPAQTSQTTPINSTNNTSNIQTTQTTPNNPVASNQPIKQIDYTSMLENIEDLLEQIKKKLNTQSQMSF